MLEQYIHGFYGYGNLDADCWFIGMEGGFKEDVEDVEKRLEKRLKTWNEWEREELEDLRDFQEEIGIDEWFGENPKSQDTWNPLIRVLLAIKRGTQEEADLDKVKRYQSEKLGRKNGETLLLELLPLPSKSTDKWIYDEYSEIEYLQSRERYRIKDLIKDNSPKFVVFYGISNKEHYKEIADTDFKELHFPNSDERALLGSNSDTNFSIMMHPVARKMSKAYSRWIGKELQEA